MAVHRQGCDGWPTCTCRPEAPELAELERQGVDTELQTLLGTPDPQGVRLPE